MSQASCSRPYAPPRVEPVGGSSWRGSTGGRPGDCPPLFWRPRGPRMAPPFCGRSIRLPGPSLCPWRPSARSLSVRRATVVSPPRGGRCPRRALAAAGSRVRNAQSCSPEIHRGARHPSPARRWAHTRRTARHPWRAASTNLQCDAQPGAPLGSPPLSITPTSFNATRRPRLGKRLSWRIAVGKAGRAARLTRWDRAHPAVPGPRPTPDGPAPTRAPARPPWGRTPTPAQLPVAASCFGRRGKSAASAVVQQRFDQRHGRYRLAG